MNAHRGLVITLACVLFVFGCGGGDGEEKVPDDGSGGSSGAQHELPPPTTSDAACIISADCPGGTHCDLGECIQGCNSEVRCSSGLTCSARGRCIEADAPDQDPPPVTEHAGSVTADPSSAELTELDDSFTVRLTTDADALVRYRVEVRAPFLRLDDPERGEFAGSKTLRFAVDPSNLEGTLTLGTILIHATLGSLTVNPSMRVGLTGRYHGLLRYSSGNTPLGDVGITVDMLDNNGDVAVRVDPEHSMTFPEVQGALATGRGLFTFSEGLAVSVAQVIDADFGGARNHFRRPIGRRVSFSLEPTGRGKLEGTFQETIYGILEQPIALSGTAYLEPVEANATLDFDVAEPPAMPTIASGVFGELSVFPHWTEEGCSLEGDCTPMTAGAALSCHTRTRQALYYERLPATLDTEVRTADFINGVAASCEAELTIASRSDYKSAPRNCALLPPLACSLNGIANGNWDTDLLPTARAAYSRLYARILAPPLLVAQNHIVEGLKESYLNGLSAQQERFRKARDVLAPPATYLLASGALEYLRRLPAQVAAGDDTAEDPTERNYPAARALARLFYVLHTLDSEQGRADAADVLGTQAAKLARAQERGLLGFFEAATLAGILDSWGNPPGLGNEFIGSLTLADRGFTGLQQGALVFGVPEGEVPLVYDPARMPPTNFEQMLAIRAQPALERFASDQAAFEAANRAFEENADRLQEQLESVRLAYEEQIRAICGSAFQFDAIQTDADWAACGADGSGEFAELTLDIQQAHLRLQASQTRIEGMRHKYRIDEKRLADTHQVRRDQIQFIDRTGKSLEGLVLQEGIINVAQKTLAIAAEASLWNGGAPLAMAAATGILEGMRTQINVARQQLQTAQEMRAVADENKIELIHGMAELQKQIIDTAQLELEMEQDTLAITQADLRRRNTLDRAKRLFDERLRALTRISESPLQDPIYRILQTRLALQAVKSRAEAQRWLYRAARALEYQINRPLGDALPRAVLGAYNNEQATRLVQCLNSIFSDYATDFGIPQEYTTTLSVREMLGLVARRVDEVTGQELSPGELFRQWILRNENIDTEGAVTVTFSTNLQPGNGLWATNVCDDKIASAQAQIVGDFQGDNEAQIVVALEGSGMMRRCDSDEIINWDMSAPQGAAIQAGVNTFGDAPPNTTLFGQSVARASWKITIPSGVTAPQNADLSLDKIEDIVLKISHRALPRQTQSIPLDVSCLGTVGAGG